MTEVLSVTDVSPVFVSESAVTVTVSEITSVPAAVVASTVSTTVSVALPETARVPTVQVPAGSFAGA